MPLQDFMRLVSVDDHLIEHPRVWLDRLPQDDHEHGPRVIETGTGAQMWTYQDEDYLNIGLNAVAGKALREWGWDPVLFDQILAEAVRDVPDQEVHAIAELNARKVFHLKPA